MADQTRINPERLAAAVMDALNETRELTEEVVQRAVDKTASQMVKDTKGAAPVRTGKYRKGWGSRVTQEPGRGAYGRTVYNRNRYQLTHLLQHGHGGPHPARAYPHIPSDAETEEAFTRNLENEMRNA